MLLVLATGAAPRATLPDIEDEVMCVECGTVLNVSSSPVADQERAFIRRQIALGKDKEQIKAALVDGVRRRACWPTRRERLRPRRCGSSRSCWRCWPRRRGRRRRRRWRRGADARAPPPGRPLSAEDARRLDAELAAFDRR